MTHGILAIAMALACAGCAASSQNGAFAARDACSARVLSAIGSSELHWRQEHTEIGPGEYLDSAEGFRSPDDAEPLRAWTRYHTDDAEASPQDVLSAFVWETKNGQRQRRTELLALGCE